MRRLLVGLVLSVIAGVFADVFAQQPGRGQGDRSPREAAPIDVTGQWVSVVTEDYRYRMVTPAKGDYLSVPLTPEGVKLADAWDPAADRTIGNQCKAYGAPGLLRLPMRLRISWQDDTTLKLETDTGTQTRFFKFGAVPPPAAASLQGHSLASWETPRPLGGSLKVVTTNLRPGYLRKNGVPYSDTAVVTEYFNRHTSFGTEWITVTNIVQDSRYLTVPFITSASFKRDPSPERWRPTPCEAD